MSRLRFPCKIENGKLTLLNRAEFDNAVANLSGEYYLELNETGVRSAQQNNYYWKCIVQELSDFTGFFPDEMHDILKVKFSTEWQTIELSENKTIGIQTLNSTARMNTKEFEVYTEQIRIWALSDLGIRLMLPNEYN